LAHIICEQTGTGSNEALLSADHAIWFYIAAAVLIVGLLVVWAAAASGRSGTEV